ncbi:ATP-binding cassette domain-containing protein [Salisediminibacterium halotolerans]|uniref:ATP-binding cassette domain-containing protein n=1 Tax=Salisediminibacterium halotolerans TaxID=517425 RepID=UPI000EAF1D38|nr:ABC transporter ATP-binding protein [Salisediminibacterium halotolerans]RLJ73214.1 ABC-2 type transport system ATP-binding protein [Actinophytocola xinjiangensis]RPE86636.1 ABC-2 type transport system ATP-binding protein [Salisediminibacterium halotolerans]TWG34011.1 ABC-2 type transport system ATP-binding protein [Salisediminibacterium halotolerans]GEL09009.1 ABC transporter [Salisediminibacterium halotolerans]
METAVKFNNVTKKFGPREADLALDNITFETARHTINGVVGRNGSGKTTLMQVIAGFKRPSSGTVEVFGVRPFNNLTVSANSIFVDDEMSFPSSLQLNEILHTAATFYPNWSASVAQDLMQSFRLPGDARHQELSKGMKSSFHAVIGLASRCPITLFDEPTVGMDETVRQEFYHWLKREYNSVPRTIFLSSHHISEIDELLEDILMMDQGRLLLNRPVADIRHHVLKVSGDARSVEAYLGGKTELYREKLPDGSVFAAVYTESPQAEDAESFSVDIEQVTLQEAVRYLSRTAAGRTDDDAH